MHTLSRFLHWPWWGYTKPTMPIEPTKERLLSTPEVAERLGITRHAVIALIKRGSLPAQKFGVNWIIRESDLALVQNRKVGRPRKGVTNT